MLKTTEDVIKAGLKADPTVSPIERTRLMARLRDSEAQRQPPPAQEPSPLIWRRAEAARMLGRSSRTLDLYAQRGLIKKRRLPGCSRAIGFLATDIRALLGD